MPRSSDRRLLSAGSAITLALALGAGCHSSSTKSESGTIQGYVCLGVYGTASTGVPVAAEAADGTRVTTTTDDNGAFTLSDVPSGSVRVILTDRVTQSVQQVELDSDGDLVLGSPCDVAPAALAVRVCITSSTDPQPGVSASASPTATTAASTWWP